MKTPFFLILSLVSAGLAVSAIAQNEAQIGDIKDNRITGRVFGSMEVGVDITARGDELADVQSMRTVVQTAVDDTGRDLIDPEKNNTEFTKYQRSGAKLGITLRLKNPARKAATIKDLSGEVQYFTPNGDPDAAVIVKSFLKSAGSQIVSDALKSAGVKITPLTQDQVNAAKPKQAGGNSGNAFSSFGSMFNGNGTSSGPNDITFKLKDPNRKLADIELQDASGNKIKGNGWTTSWTASGDQMERTITYHFQSKLPNTTCLVVYLATPKSLISIPFSFRDVYLP